MPITRPIAAAAVTTLLTAPALAGGEGWITSMDDAMARAKAEGKSILIDFTGSDWCGWCIRLDNEVFSQSIFKEYAPEKFVLVELDFPRRKELPAEQKAHNEKWRDTFGIGGYPTIILADAGGEEFARTGYQPGGPAPYVDHLDTFLSGKKIRDAALDAAAKVDGPARAKMLDWALSVEGITVPDAEGKMREIIALDPDDLTGLKDTYQRKINDIEARAAFDQLRMRAFREGDPVGAAAGAQELLESKPLSIEMEIELIAFRVMTLAMAEEAEAAQGVIDAFLARDDIESVHRQQMTLAEMNLHLGAERWEEAIASFDRAIELDRGSDVGKSLIEQRGQFMQMIEARRSGGGQGIPATRLVEPEGDGGSEG